MKPPDDYALQDPRREKVRKEAKRLLSEVGALGKFPTPVQDVLAIARLEIVPEDLANPSLLRRLRDGAGGILKRALSKVRGIFDARGGLIFLDHTIQVVKQTFVTFHEIAHSVLPWQRGVYSVMEDCDQFLDPDVKDGFEREANIFASEVLFQLDGFITEARELQFGLATPLKVGRRYGASAYAAIRQYVIKHHRPCAVVVLNPPETGGQLGFHMTLRRVFRSQSFLAEVGRVEWAEVYTPSHPFWDLMPLGKRRMSSPRQLVLKNSDGVSHSCIAEGFATPFNTFILILVDKTLRSTIILPPALRMKSSTLAPLS